MSTKPYLTWALNREGDLVHVDEVPNGNECGCVCPHCKSKLCAKNGGDGEKMIHHFAHLSGADCVGAVESALHKMAKDVLFESRCVFLPDRYDGRKGELLHFDKVEVEYYDKGTNLRPDCLGYYEDKSLWIEFKRSHAVDTRKKGKIISAHIDCIEIDLNGCSLDPGEMRNFLINTSYRRVWIRDTSSKTRSSGHASGGTYCDRYDDYDEKRPIIRRYAKDENGELVALNDDKANTNVHTYYCLSCGKELTIDVDEHGGYKFIHLDEIYPCRDDMYLYKAAKEIVSSKFSNTLNFPIAIPQEKQCIEKSSCPYFNEEECRKESSFTYNIKEHGYTECLKDYKFPGNNYKCDIVFKRSDDMSDAIIVTFDTETIHVEATSIENRIVEVQLYDEESLDVLFKSPLGTRGTTFINFRKKNIAAASRTEIERPMEKFELFTSGKYHLGIETCSHIRNRKRSTAYELVFAGDTMDVHDAKIYALHKCFNLKLKACYCELCYFLAEYTSYGLIERICKRYKTKGTPRYPLNERPMDCEYFSMNRGLIEKVLKDYDGIKDVETLF